MSAADEVHLTLARVARQSRGRLTTSLARALGVRHLSLIEDAVSEAVLKALSTWQYDGVPDEPVAWLQTVARRRAIDALRRSAREVDLSGLAEGESDEAPAEVADEGDPELALVALCFAPVLSTTDQLALALRVVSGFTAHEIATVFLAGDDAMAARLTRARKKLAREDRDAVVLLAPSALADRQDELRQFCYLLFALGYAPRFGDAVVRDDVAAEALRLTRLLARHPQTKGPRSSALAALLCFQSSRLPARIDADGQPVRLRDSDRSLWDRVLISEGLAWLADSASGFELSRYHLEADIASAYAAAPSFSEIDWPRVLHAFSQLADITDSPVVRLNQAIAMMEAGELDAAAGLLAALADTPALSRLAAYHVARSELASLRGDAESAAVHLKASLDCPVSAPLSEHLLARLDALTEF